MKLKNLLYLTLFVVSLLSCSNDDDGGSELQLDDLILSSPSNGERPVSITPEFSWQEYIDEGTVTYSVFLGTTSGGLSEIVSDLSATDFRVAETDALALEGNFFWKVVAYSDGQEVAESATQSFITETLSPVNLTENANFSKRIRASAAAFNDKLWIIGGTDESGSDLTDIWSSSDGITWTDEGDFPFGTVFSHKLIVFNNKLWLYGGVIGGFVSTKIYSSVNGVDWIEETETTPFSQYNQVIMTVMDNKIFRIAGYNAAIDDLTDERATYSSIDGLNWDLLTENHGFETKYGFRAEAIDNKLVVLEPSSDTDENSITLYSSADGITWNNQRTWMTAERGYSSIKTFGFGDKLILVTPPPSNISSQSTFYESDNGVDWTPATLQITSLTARNYDFVNLNGKLYAVGGITLTFQTASADNQVWRLN